MEKEQVQELQHGVYKIFWKESDYPWCAGVIGSLSNGDRWFSCANWTAINTQAGLVSSNWEQIDKVELIMLHPYDFSEIQTDGHTVPKLNSNGTFVITTPDNFTITTPSGYKITIEK